MRRWPQVPPGSASLVERALWTWIQSCRTALGLVEGHVQGAAERTL